MILQAQEWRERQNAHVARVDAAVAGHLQRRRHGRAHPVEDFLWIYFRLRPSRLRRWHPGPGIALADAASSAPHATWRHYELDDNTVRFDTMSFLADKEAAVRKVHELLTSTASRPARFGCFGLHEWAMVYRAEEARHPWPLRLGAAGTDEVVESRPLRCTHYDAYRFFTPDAAPLNESRPTPQGRAELEQPGCLHAGMDLYRWAYTLSPGLSSELVMDCFEHARSAREIDMRASPYDLRDLGYEPIAIETSAGRARYVQEQHRLAAAAAPLRRRLIAVCEGLLGQGLPATCR